MEGATDMLRVRVAELERRVNSAAQSIAALTRELDPVRTVRPNASVEVTAGSLSTERAAGEGIWASVSDGELAQWVETVRAGLAGIEIGRVQIGPTILAEAIYRPSEVAILAEAARRLQGRDR